MKKIFLLSFILKSTCLFSASIDLDVAITDNKLDKVKELVASGIIVNKTPNFTQKILRACRDGHNDMVKYLLNFYDKSKKSILIYYLLITASVSGNLEIIKYFFDMGINTKFQDLHGNSLLHIACANKQINIVKYLIETEHNINATNVANQTPFHIALQAQDLDIILYLLSASPDLIREKICGEYILEYFSANTIIQLLFILVGNSTVDIPNRYFISKVPEIRSILHELFALIYKNYPTINNFGIYKQIEFIRETYIQVIESGCSYGIKRLKNLFFVFSSADLAYLIKKHIRNCNYNEQTENTVITLVKKAILEYRLSSLKDYSGYNLLHHALKHNRENLSRFLIFASNKLMDNLVNVNIPEFLRICQIYYQNNTEKMDQT